MESGNAEQLGAFFGNIIRARMLAGGLSAYNTREAMLAHRQVFQLIAQHEPQFVKAFDTAFLGALEPSMRDLWDLFEAATGQGGDADKFDEGLGDA